MTSFTKLTMISRPWSLQMFLHQLSWTPFEPLATTSDHLLTLKTIFLVAITSTRCASELVILHSDPLFLQFHPDQVTWYPDMTFLPKVVTINLLFYLPFPIFHHLIHLHSLDIKHALAFTSPGPLPSENPQDYLSALPIPPVEILYLLSFKMDSEYYKTSLWFGPCPITSTSCGTLN